MEINMDNDYILLTSDDAIKIIYLGVKGSVDFYIFDTQKNIYHKLTRGDVEKIRKKPSSVTGITTSPAQMNKVRKVSIAQFAHDESIGLADLWVRKEKYNEIFFKLSAEKEKLPKESDIGIWANGGEIAEMNANKALAIMAFLLSSKPKYKIGNRPNCKQIADDVNEQAKNYFGEDKAQFESFHKRLGNALKLLSSESSFKNE